MARQKAKRLRKNPRSLASHCIMAGGGREGEGTGKSLALTTDPQLHTSHHAAGSLQELRHASMAGKGHSRVGDDTAFRCHGRAQAPSTGWP